MTDRPASAALDEVFRAEWPRLVGYVAHLTHDLDAAEEIVQESLFAALRRWPLDGVPANAVAWLTTTCRNRAFNHLRDSRRRQQREGSGVEHLTVSDVIGAPPGPLADDRLRLIFLCCHPELPPTAQMELTLRLVAGLSTADIARAFLVSEPAMAQRITRAKRLASDRGLSFECPEATELPARLAVVVDVVYLIFNEGYLARAGAVLQQVALADEAHRLAVLLTVLLPDEAGPWALRALIALQHSRSAARSNDTGDLVPLPEQDRGLWDQTLIAEGRAALAQATALGRRTSLIVQAEIASLHAGAATWADTDWPAILALYDELAASTPSPVIALNRAVAVGMVEGPGPALAALDELADRVGMQSQHLFWAVRGEQLWRLGQAPLAIDAFDTARALTTNDVERRHLTSRIDQCRASLHADQLQGESHGTR